MGKKWVIFLVAVGMVLTLGACGGKKQQEAVKNSKNFVYKSEAIDFGDAISKDSLNSMVIVGDSMYAYGYEWDDNGSTMTIANHKLDGSVTTSIKLPLTNNQSITVMEIGGDGNYYAIMNEYGEVTTGTETPDTGDVTDTTDPGISIEPRVTEETTETNTTNTADTAETDTAETDTAETDTAETDTAEADSEAEQASAMPAENTVWTDEYFFIVFDSQGKEIIRKQIGENAEEGYYYVSTLKMLPNGQLLLMDSEGIKLIDKEGSVQKQVADQKELESASVYMMADGTPVIYSYKSEKNNYGFNKLNLDTGALSEDIYTPANATNYTIFTGAGCDFFMVSNTSVYSYNLGDESVTELMNFVDSDLNTSYLASLQGISLNELYGIISDDLEGKNVVMKFTKVDPKDVVDKKIMTLGSNGLDWDVRRQVVAFNKSNSEYRIQIKDYSEYNTNEDYTLGLTRLNTDIASGKVPDILVIDRNMPIASYEAKGLFADLYPMIESDSELKIEDFLQNIFKAYEFEGKLYRMVPSFSVNTVTGKTKDVGPDPGITLAELLAVMDGKPEGTKVFQDMTRSDLLSYCIQLSSSQFLDWETGKCNFNSQGFMNFLEFMKTFPEQRNEAEFGDDYWQKNEVAWREGTILLNTTYLDSYSTYNFLKKGTFGDDITFIGFPSENKKGTAIFSNMDFAISEKSAYKDGAWQFLRYFLSEDYQSKISYGWPITIKAIDRLAEEAKKKPTYEDENGNLVEYEPTFTAGDLQIPITTMTDEEIQVVRTFIESLDQVYTYDQNLINIIEEEAAPFFSGQKTAKEAADIIQSRVQIYVNESR